MAESVRLWTAVPKPGFDTHPDLRFTWYRWLFLVEMRLGQDTRCTRYSEPEKTSEKMPKKIPVVLVFLTKKVTVLILSDRASISVGDYRAFVYLLLVRPLPFLFSLSLSLSFFFLLLLLPFLFSNSLLTIIHASSS
jgi:hypothetical protein